MEYLRKNRERNNQLYTETPELEVYIVNLHPLVPKDIPQDKDLIDDRVDFNRKRMAYNKFVKRIESKNMSSDRKEILIGPGRDIVALISEAENLKLVNK
jgi:hypothetical protein